MHRDTRFHKSTTVAEAYDPYSVGDGFEDEEEEVAAAEWNWGKKTVMVPNPWGRGVEESYCNRTDQFIRAQVQKQSPE